MDMNPEDDWVRLRDWSVEVEPALRPILESPEFTVLLSGMGALIGDNRIDEAHAVSDFCAAEIKRRLREDDYPPLVGEPLNQWLMQLATEIWNRSNTSP